MSQDLYLEFFGLDEPPFQLTPDAEFLYLSTQHSLAQAYLNYSLLKRDSFVVITGEIGSGKTTLINKLLSEVQKHVTVARLFQTQVTPSQFLQAILLEFGIRPFGKKKVELLHLFNKFLVDQHRNGHQVVLIVDEAQNLSQRVLEEIRLLSDVETDKTKILNVVLCGQPGLRNKLDAPGLAQLSQRIRYRFHINALTLVETEEYIEHRLRVAGAGDTALFGTGTVPIVYRYSGGIPRLINILCDTALTGAFAEDAPVVTPRVLESAVAELDWRPYHERHHASSPQDAPLEARREAYGKLVLTHKGDFVRDFILDGQRSMIGRDSDNDIQIVAEFVSRHHAQVALMNGVCWLSDLNSTNGTWVNGSRVGKRALCDGDTIQLGRHRLTYSAAPGGTSRAGDSNAEQMDSWRETTVLPMETTHRFGSR